MLLSLLLSLLQNFCNKSLFVKCARERRIYDRLVDDFKTNTEFTLFQTCLLYTSDAADEDSSV